MPNENDILLKAMLAELRAHNFDLSLRCATLAGELAVLKARVALSESQTRSKDTAL